MSALISLVGEQPIPVLFPVRHLKPKSVLLMCSQRTRRVAERLQWLIAKDAECSIVEIEPYRLPGIVEDIRGALAMDSDLIFNLTGGTKPMSFAALMIAGKLNARIIYLESEEKKKLLYSYHFKDGHIQADYEHPEVLPELITIDDYLSAHVKFFEAEGPSRDKSGKITDGGMFEQSIERIVKEAGMEVMTGVRPAGVADQIEIDHVIRMGNNVGIAEVKLGGEDGQKKGLDQLAMAGGREYLGTYTSKFLIIARSLNRSLHELARARGIHIVEIGYDERRHEISSMGKTKLLSELKRQLGD